MWSRSIYVTVTGSAFQQNWTGYVSQSPSALANGQGQCGCVANVSIAEWMPSGPAGRSSLSKMMVLWQRCAAHANDQPPTTKNALLSLRRRFDKDSAQTSSDGIAPDAPMLWYANKDS